MTKSLCLNYSYWTQVWCHAGNIPTFSTAGIKTLRPASHQRDTESGEGDDWHSLNCQAAIKQFLLPSKSETYPINTDPPTFVFFQHILISLEVFLFVRKRISLRCVLSHNPGFPNWTFTSDGQGHSTGVCMCAYACVWIQSAVGAVVVWKETPYNPPLSALRPIDGTSSPDFTRLIGRTVGRAALQKN